MSSLICTKDYPLNLLDVLAGEEWEHDIPVDFEGSLAYVLATLTKREQNVIIQRFKECRTYEDIGKDYNITRERIRQLEAKGLRKLRHPTRMKFLKYGIKGWYLHEKENELQCELTRVVDELTKIAEAITAVDGMDKLMKLAADKERWKKDHPQLDMPLEDLELSVRSYNCLKRAGIRTLGDIANSTAYELMHVRNLGRQSFEEIVQKLHEYGLTLKNEEENQ